MFVTKAHLERVRNEYVKKRSLDALYEASKQFKRVSRPGETTIFLSHKHDDKKEIEEAIALLHSIGVFVYVDWMDKGMPSTTSGITARRIKSKIIENNKFILLATQGAIDSKWCNWELGFADANKNIQNIALLPVAENDGAWHGSEYLQIYPVIKSKYDYFVGTYYVDYEGKITRLEDWIRRLI